MNILFIAPFCPYPLDQGGKIRVFNLIKYLSRNHRITLACLSFDTAPDCGPLVDFCDEVIVIERPESFAWDFARFLLGGETFNCRRFASQSFAGALSELAARKSFDLVQIEFSMLWQYARYFPGLPVYLDAHNIEYRNVQQIGNEAKNPVKRLLYRLETKRLKALEEQSWRECALCFAVSDNERDDISAHSKQAVTASNGVDPDRFVFRNREKSGKKILFLGGMDYSPNLDAARFFLCNIFPLIRRKEPEAQVLLVGRELGKLGSEASLPGVECHESVAEVLPWFYEADLLAVPLRQGAGTRIKVLEAMAAGLPVVTTSKGCEGIAVENGLELLIADTAEEFAAAVLQILTAPDKGRGLAQCARRLVEKQYTWESAAKHTDDQYHRILGR